MGYNSHVNHQENKQIRAGPSIQRNMYSNEGERTVTINCNCNYISEPHQNNVEQKSSELKGHTVFAGV